MNWVGGARNRMRQKDERKQQKDFFEKKRFTAKVAKALATMKSRSAVSQDIISLNTIKKMHAQQPSQGTRVTKIDLDRAKPAASRRLEHVELSDVSPIKCVSKIPLLDAKESKKEQLQKQEETSNNKPLQRNLFRSVWGPGPGNRKNELKTPLDQILPRKRSAASSIYALASDSVSLRKVEDDSQHTQHNQSQDSTSKVAQSECEDETPFIHSFNSYALLKTGKAVDQTIPSSQFKTPAISDWFSQPSHKPGFQELAHRKSSLWSGCSFPSQAVKLESSSPPENLPDNFWKQPMPYPKDVDIFASNRRIQELYQSDEPVRPKIKRHSKERTQPFISVPEPTISEEIKYDSDSLEILDDEAFNKQQPRSLKDDHLKVDEPMEANAATGSPDLPIMGSRIYQARMDTIGRSKTDTPVIKSGLPTPVKSIVNDGPQPDLSQQMMVPCQFTQEDGPLDLSVKALSNGGNDPVPTEPANDECPLKTGSELDANGANGKCHIETKCVPQSCNLEEPLALVCSSRQQDFQKSCNQDVQINNIRNPLSKTPNTNRSIQNTPVTRHSMSSENPQKKEYDSFNTMVNDTGDIYTARSNYRSRAERAFSFTKTPLITRQTKDSQDHHDFANSNDDSHEKDAFPVRLTSVSKDCNSGMSCSTNNGQRDGNKAKLDGRNSLKAFGCETPTVAARTDCFNTINVKGTVNAGGAVNTVTPNKNTPSQSNIEDAKFDQGTIVSKQVSTQPPKRNNIDKTVLNMTKKGTSVDGVSDSPRKRQVCTSINTRSISVNSCIDVKLGNSDLHHKMRIVKNTFSCSAKPTVPFSQVHKTPNCQPKNKLSPNSVDQDMKNAVHLNNTPQQIQPPITTLNLTGIENTYSNVNVPQNGFGKCSPVTSSPIPTREQPDLTIKPAGASLVVSSTLNTDQTDSSLYKDKNTDSLAAGGPVLSITGNNRPQLQYGADSSVCSLSAQLSFDSLTTGDSTNENSDARQLAPQNDVTCACESNSLPFAPADVALSPFLIHQLMHWRDKEDFTQQFTPSEVITTRDIRTQCELMKSATFVHKFTQTDQQPPVVPELTCSTSVQCDILKEEPSRKKTNQEIPERLDEHVNTYCTERIQPTNIDSFKNQDIPEKDTTELGYAHLPNANNKRRTVEGCDTSCLTVRNLNTDEVLESCKKQQHEIGDSSESQAEKIRSGIAADTTDLFTDQVVLKQRTAINCQADDNLHPEPTKDVTSASVPVAMFAHSPDNKEHGQGRREHAEISVNYVAIHNYAEVSDNQHQGEGKETLPMNNQAMDKSDNVSKEIPNISDDAIEDSNDDRTSTQESIYESAEEANEDTEPDEMPLQNAKICNETRSKKPLRSRLLRKTRASTRWKPPVK